MKTLSRLSFVYLISGVLLIICSCGPNSPSTDIPADTQAKFAVLGLTCPSCEFDIKSRLLELKGVAKVKVALGTKKPNGKTVSDVEVDFDSTETTIETIKKTTEENKKFKILTTFVKKLAIER